MAEFTARIAVNEGDAVERSDNTNFASDPVAAIGVGLVYGRSGAGGNPFWYSGFRFPNVTIPNGATITSAVINFTARSNFSMTAGITVDIYCENVDNSADFATTADVVDRARTTATAAWSAPNTGTTDVAVNSADFTTAVKEVVDRAGWASGNALMVLLRESAGTAGESADYYFYENSTTKCALLTINYTTGGGVNSGFFNLM